MAKEIDPRVATLIGGQNQEQKKAPWNPANCYRMYFPLHPERIYYFANNSDDPESGWGLSDVPGQYLFLKLVSVRANAVDEPTRPVPPTLAHHRNMRVIGIGMVVDEIQKPSWWEAAHGK